jgi:CheY-like chemotaxis protein
MPSKTIMIVDDNSIDQIIARKLIENVIQEVSFMFFTRADEALEFVRSEKGEEVIILLDLDFPVFNGFDFLEGIEKTSFTAPIYIVSILPTDIILQERKDNLLVKRIFQKPLKREDILSLAHENNLLLKR